MQSIVFTDQCLNVWLVKLNLSNMILINYCIEFKWKKTWLIVSIVSIFFGIMFGIDVFPVFSS